MDHTSWTTEVVLWLRVRRSMRWSIDVRTHRVKANSAFARMTADGYNGGEPDPTNSRFSDGRTGTLKSAHLPPRCAPLVCR
jgi:hypothetical protein